MFAQLASKSDGCVTVNNVPEGIGTLKKSALGATMPEGHKVWVGELEGVQHSAGTEGELLELEYPKDLNVP